MLVSPKDGEGPVRAPQQRVAAASKSSVPQPKSILKKPRCRVSPSLSPPPSPSDSSDRSPPESRASSPGLVLDASSRAFKDRQAEDDAEILALEKKLGLKKGKTPRLFAEDGFGDLLDELDTEVEGKKRRREDKEWRESKRRKAEAQQYSRDREGGSGSGWKELDEGRVEWDASSASEDGDCDDDEQSRVRENPYAPPASANSTGKYVPPSLRKAQSTKGQNDDRLHRQVQGHLNKLSEANLVSILNEVEKLYQSNPRQEVTSVLIDLLLSLFSDRSSLQNTFVILHAAFITAVYRVVGTDFGAELLSRLVERFTEHHGGPQGHKAGLNLMSLLANLFTFNMIGSAIVYDYIYIFLGALTEANTELLLRIIRDCGLQLRADDPVALKAAVSQTQSKARAFEASGQAVSVRTKFLVETIVDLKNNKMRDSTANSGLTKEHITRMRKVLGSLNSRPLRVTEPLRVSLSDLQNSEKKGKWWLVGASWKGHSACDSATLHHDQGKPESVDGGDAFAVTARDYGLTTPLQQLIFAAISGADTYVDAHVRVSKLRLKRSQEPEIARVILRLCGSEQQYNPFYAHLAKQLCSIEGGKRMKKTFDFALWAFFRRLGENANDGNEDEQAADDGDVVAVEEINNIAHLYADLIRWHVTDLAVVKVLDLQYLKEHGLLFAEMMLVRLLVSCKHDTEVQAIFERAAGATQPLLSAPSVPALAANSKLLSASNVAAAYCSLQVYMSSAACLLIASLHLPVLNVRAVNRMQAKSPAGHGKYDIFVIPPSSSGSGFLYLPSLNTQRNSFLAGVACTAVAFFIWNITVPIAKEWLYSTFNGGGSGVFVLLLGVGVLSWAFGKTQAEGAQTASNLGGSGPGSSGASAAKSSWEKAREEMRKKEEERRRAEELKKKREEMEREKLKQREKELKERIERELKEKKAREAKAASPPKRPPIPTAHTADDDAYSFRPYDRPKKAYKANSGASMYSESSYAESQTTARTTPPPSFSGPYVTKDPDKIVIRGVYSFNNAFIRKPVAQLVSGQGPVTDGLILRITTEGLFIDDDRRGVPQREWDAKAWTLKLAESCEMAGLHILRASIRDQEGKKYVFVLPQTEGWKVAVGLQRLRRGSQSLPPRNYDTFEGSASDVVATESTAHSSASDSKSRSVAEEAQRLASQGSWGDNYINGTPLADATPAASTVDEMEDHEAGHAHHPSDPPPEYTPIAATAQDLVTPVAPPAAQSDPFQAHNVSPSARTDLPPPLPPLDLSRTPWSTNPVPTGEYIRHETSTPIYGTFDLLDLLDLETTSGSIFATINLQPGEKPARLRLATTSGSITVRMESSQSQHDNSTTTTATTRIIHTQITSQSGSIRGDLIHSIHSRTEISSHSGSLIVTVNAVGTSGTSKVKATSIATNSTNTCVSDIAIEATQTNTNTNIITSTAATEPALTPLLCTSTQSGSQNITVKLPPDDESVRAVESTHVAERRKLSEFDTGTVIAG
ncbi:hypothetical protein DV737_g4214, partial [Chaetothyriales sp. CBS 132003]